MEQHEIDRMGAQMVAASRPSPAPAVTDDMVERAARALCMADMLGGFQGGMDVHYVEANWPKYCGKARVALEAALQPAQAEA